MYIIIILKFKGMNFVISFSDFFFILNNILIKVYFII